MALLQRVIAFFISLSTIGWMLQYKSQDIMELKYPNYLVVNIVYAVGIFLVFHIFTVVALILNLKNSKITQKHYDRKLYSFVIKPPYLLICCWFFTSIPIDFATDYFALLRGTELFSFFWSPAPFVILSSTWCANMTWLVVRKLK